MLTPLALGGLPMNWGWVAEGAAAIFAGAAALFSFLGWRSARRVEWLTGAMESHSTMQIRMQAKRDNLRVEAYDPDLRPYPGDVPLEGKEWKLETVYLALPPTFRANKRTSSFARIVGRRA